LTADLFDTIADVQPPREAMADGAVLLRGFVLRFEGDLIPALREIVAQAPFRHMSTPGGHQMSVAMTNCGNAGWVTDRTGYRYDGVDPESGQPWPKMPAVLRELRGDFLNEDVPVIFLSARDAVRERVQRCRERLSNRQAGGRLRDGDRLSLNAPGLRRVVDDSSQQQVIAVFKAHVREMHLARFAPWAQHGQGSSPRLMWSN